MARQFWPTGDPLADRLVIGGKAVGPEFEEPPRQIVGVVGDVRDGGLNNDPRPAMYIPFAPVPDDLNALNRRSASVARWVRMPATSATWSMRLSLAGVIIGIGSAFAVSRVLATLLFGVTTRDPMVFVMVPSILAVVALGAVWLPARRASRIDPLTALRYE